MKLPDFDPASGENRYEFVLRAAAEVRASRQTSDALIRAKQGEKAATAARKFDEQVEKEDRERLKGLRAKYDQNRSKATYKIPTFQELKTLGTV